MKKEQDRRENSYTLRRRAEDRLTEKGKDMQEAPGEQSAPVEMQRLVQELQIHKIELEMQNEELKRARDEAEAERERYLDLYDFSPVGYFILDRDGAILQVNLTGARLLGMERCRLLNRRFGHFVSEADVPAFNEFLKTMSEDRSKQDCTLSLSREGCPGLRVHIEAISTGDGRECRAAVLDVTERTKAEDDVRKLHGELERRSAEHIVQLEVSNKELDSFSYTISHDLQAPLRAIDGYTRMILTRAGDRFDEDTARRFEVIRRNAQKMGQLINDLLAFSRLGRREVSLAEVDMEAVFAEGWEDLQAIQPDRTMTLKSSGLPPGMGDRALIMQVARNLLSNSVKFSRSRGEAVVEVGGYREGNETVYFVRDYGAGFDMAYYGKLFGMFQQLHDPDEFEGTGIGMAIAQRIINRHGGRIWAEGEVDKGATFSFTLPNRKE